MVGRLKVERAASSMEPPEYSKIPFGALWAELRTREDGSFHRHCLHPLHCVKVRMDVSPGQVNLIAESDATGLNLGTPLATAVLLAAMCSFRPENP